MKLLNTSSSLLVIFVILGTTVLADPTTTSSTVLSPTVGHCPPLACVAPSGTPTCPISCSNNCHFVEDRCCPQKKVAVCNSSSSDISSNTPSATTTSTSVGISSSSSTPGSSSTSDSVTSPSSSTSPTPSSANSLYDIYYSYQLYMMVTLLFIWSFA
ncbi:unnamed protein product [Cunninghamella echinulata]